MSGNQWGATKSAARRLGISVSEYATHILLGEKWCFECRAWKRIAEFGKDARRGDGRAASCLVCRESGSAGPSRRERAAAAKRGESWCRGCEQWHPSAQVTGGQCRTHHNADWRTRYATDPKFRHAVRQRVLRRKRGVDDVPPVAVEYLLEDFEGQCAYCGGLPETWDHIVPVSRGGITAPWNIVPACKSCNSRKKDRDVYDFVEAMGGAVHGDRIEARMLLDHLPTIYEAQRAAVA